MQIINGEQLDDSVDEPERCPVCGGHEPCSHNFDEMREQLEAIGRKMGTEVVARICEWRGETPIRGCSKPAVCRTVTGEILCQEHGNQEERHWPGSVETLCAPND